MISLAAACIILGQTSTSAKSPDFPRIGMLWSPYEGAGSLWQKAGRYSLALVGPGSLGLEWSPAENKDLATTLKPETIPAARKILADFMPKHPSTLLLVESYFYEADTNAYPEDSPWWFRDDKGKKVQFWEGCFNMAVDNPDYIKHIATRIEAVADATQGKTGLYLDNLRLDPVSKKGWLSLLSTLRAKRPSRYVMVNAGWASDDLAWVAPQINGIMYEDSVHHTTDGKQEAFYKRVADFDKLMKKPTLSINEIFGKREDKETPWREICRTLLYTDAAYLYSDSTYGHRHNWRSEWSQALGPALEKVKTPNGQAQVRKFRAGAAAWNPGTKVQTLNLGAKYKNVRTGWTGSRLTLKAKESAFLVKQPAR